jgi:alpha-glucosidase
MGLLQQLSLAFTFAWKSLFFLQYIPAAFVYSLKRDRLEQRYIPALSSEPLILPGRLQQAKATDRGAAFYFEQAELEIAFLTPTLVRVNWFPGLAPIPYAIAKQNWEWVETRLEQQEHGWTIATDSLSIAISLDGCLTVRNAAGKIVREEQPPERQGEQWIHRARLRSEEQIYGLGERAASLNLRTVNDPQQPHKIYQMWNYDPGGRYGPGTDPLYICIPVYLGLHDLDSYLIFYENSFRAEFTFAEEALAHFTGGALRYYITIGQPADLLKQYTELTGRAPLPPRWALGYHQSRWGDRTEATVQQEVEAFQAHDLPLSAVHLDIDCQVDHRAFTLDPKRFPNLDRFTQNLSKAGVRLIAINNPGIRYSRHSNLFLEGQILNAFCTYPTGELVVAPVWAGRTAFPDFTNPKVRAWWSRQYAYLLDVGVSGFWHDMNEPAAFVIWGDHSLPNVAQHCLEGRGGDHREAHNLYGLLEAEAGYQSIRQYRPNQRPFIVSRSGWAGLQRYAWTWTGDTISTWEALRQTIATVIGLGLSGIPYSGPDIGGFQGNPSAELYLRWFQMATFLTFYRTHSSTSVSPRAPWTYPEPYLSILHRFLHLRYQLMPYLYTLAWKTTQKGYPPVRPLFWVDPSDRSLWNIEDAFCLGDALLICPIVREGERSRTVTLPKGQWYEFWTDALIQGGETVQLEAPLERIPILVKAGSIIPMENQAELVLHLYPPKLDECISEVYSDAGDGYEESRIDRFRLTYDDHELKLIWKHQGDYDFPYKQVQIQVHGLSCQHAWVDEHAVPIQEQRLQCQAFEQVRFHCD